MQTGRVQEAKHPPSLLAARSIAYC